MRDYHEVVKRVEALQNGAVRVHELGCVEGYPVLCARVPDGEADLPPAKMNIRSDLDTLNSL